MEQHVKIIAWLHIARGALLLLIAGGVFMTMTGASFFADSFGQMAGIALVAVVVAGFMSLFSIPSFLAGWGLLNRKSWARILAMIIGVFGLLDFPFGMALGVYTLWALWGDRADYIFESRNYDSYY